MLHILHELLVDLDGIHNPNKKNYKHNHKVHHVLLVVGWVLIKTKISYFIKFKTIDHVLWVCCVELDIPRV
jgi:hypothetical protein